MKNFFKKNNMLYRFFAVIGLIFGGGLYLILPCSSGGLSGAYFNLIVLDVICIFLNGMNFKFYLTQILGVRRAYSYNSFFIL